MGKQGVPNRSPDDHHGTRVFLVEPGDEPALGNREERDCLGKLWLSSADDDAIHPLAAVADIIAVTKGEGAGPKCSYERYSSAGLPPVGWVWSWNRFAGADFLGQAAERRAYGDARNDAGELAGR